MPNWVENRVTVIGGPEQVAAFVKAARGLAEVDLGSQNATERSIIAAVRDGVPVDQAFEDANRRVDVRRDEIGEIHPALDDGDLRIEPVAEAGFEAWAAGVEAVRGPEIKLRMSAISFASLVPPPDWIRDDSFNLVGYHWALKNWGVKWGADVEEPDIVELPDGRSQAVYPVFDTANDAPTAALVAASRSHPDLTLFAFAMDGDNDQFEFKVIKGGEIVGRRSFMRSDIPESAIEREEDDPESMGWVSGKALFEICIYDAMVEADHAPGMAS